MAKRTAFFVSDGTGITAEALGNSLLTQFEQVDFKRVTIPYINSPEKALKVVQQVARAMEEDQARPIIFDTIVQPEVRAVMAQSDALTIDIFGTFISRLEQELAQQSTHRVGRQRIIDQSRKYPVRIEAMNYALENDDGAVTRDYDKADIILVGVSRCGKTPTCLYLALQFGIKAANYPITDDDLEENELPKSLRPHKTKIYGLTIDPVRLQAIRQERKPDSRYSSARQCQMEVRGAESLFRRVGIPFIDSTHYSVEEISTHILTDMGLRRQI